MKDYLELVTHEELRQEDNHFQIEVRKRTRIYDLLIAGKKYLN